MKKVLRFTVILAIALFSSGYANTPAQNVDSEKIDSYSKGFAASTYNPAINETDY